MPSTLVIVESPAKAKKISEYLGRDYVVMASIGHVRDLETKGLAVDVDNHFKPSYAVYDNKKKVISELKAALRDADELLLATDEDREGEAISWHLVEVLKPRVPVRRMVFHEITRQAIERAVEESRDIDYRLVDAQESRRIVDRLFGYPVSEVCWRKIRQGLSAGRVQSPAVRLVVERERERMAFVAADYSSLTATFPTEPSFAARLHTLDGVRVASGTKDFDHQGRPKDGVVVLDGDAASALASAVGDAAFSVASVETSAKSLAPRAPFITSTLQQVGGSRLSMSAQQVMRVAQGLYERGYITYMRTDSTTLSETAVSAARAQIAQRFGSEFLPDAPRRYASKSKNAQEAHEAIRPAGETFRTPDEVRGELHGTDLRLYELIWQRTVASQMVNARAQDVTVTIDADASDEAPSGGASEAMRRVDAVGSGGGARAEGSASDEAPSGEASEAMRRVDAVGSGGGARAEGSASDEAPSGEASEAMRARQTTWRASGRTILFPGWMAVYGFAGEDADAGDDDTARLPQLSDGDALPRPSIEAEGHSTQPPARYTEAQLVKALEEKGIGRPSTYASIMGTIQDRGYVWKKGQALVPTSDAFAVVNLLEGHFRQLVDYDFTARMENDLDEIAGGRQEREPWLRRFWFGNGVAGLKDLCSSALESADPAEVNAIPIGADDDGVEIVVRNGKFGPYVKRGGDTASLPPDIPLDELTVGRALELLSAPKGDEPIGTDPASGLPVYVKNGRFGPYVQLGDAETLPPKQKPKMASLFKAMQPESVTVDDALRLLSLPRVVGVDPDSAEEVTAQNGRYGPYLKKGSDSRSLDTEEQLFTVTLEEALAIYAQPKTFGRQRAAAKPPLRELGVDPAVDKPVVIRDGRFGPYITDGEYNATVPRSETVEGIEPERAFELLADKRAAGPAQKGTRTRTAGAKKAATRQGAAKKSGAKKAAARKRGSGGA